MQSEKLRKLALLCVMLVPLGLLHAWVLAEICIGIVDVLFLAQAGARRDFAWARQPWFILASLWWVWLVVCSTPLPLPDFAADGWPGFIQAFLIIRLILFAAALQSWLLTTPGARRAAWSVLALSAAWIAVESWQQYLTGHNIFGWPRWGDGSLTGPFQKPRAGDIYAHLMFIAVLPPAMALLARPGWPPRLAGMALAVLATITAVLIGQRMGVAFAGLGLAVAAVFLPRLRLPLGVALALAIAVLIATPLISPATHGKLVGETQRNFHHFSQSPYGEIFTRATVMGLQSPLHGWGYRGYRAACMQPRFNQGLPALGIPPTQTALSACNLHPQNFYIQAFSDAGFPGLALFVALMLYWTWLAARGLWRNPDPVRVGLLIGIINYTWPIASTDEFPALYMLGWFFFFIGLSLACAGVAPNPPFVEAKNV
ncbi:O-antigen ligase [Acidocella sp.]|uniref:O-antigen ligase family protein n=1 Tax=Acidocella sp. TaxID=50710 RepID=UPI0026259C36|nr:O-antigen ligase family protein [Acidocella sp.]